MLSHLVAAALAATLAAPIPVSVATADPVPLACPEVFAHGGYPSEPNPWDRDQVRQPNNPTALADYQSKGAVGVEADVQLTRDGTKAVMWHNDTTWALTGSTMSVNNMRWDTGADKLNGRTLTVGPYQGEVVYTLRQYLDAIAELGMVPLIEVKGVAKQSLLNADAAIRDRAWSELLDPVSERIEDQEIMLHTLDDELRAELVERLAAAGLSGVLEPGPHRPVWPDSVAWEEPPPSWEGNQAAWQEALEKEPQRIATDWPAEFTEWMADKCE